MAKATAREICIKMADGSQYCKRSPIRDCGCDRDPNFKDPFSEVPSTLDPASFIADFQEVLKVGIKELSPTDLAERLRLALVIGRLLLLPKDIDQAFFISSLDLPIYPIPTPKPPTAE